MKLCALAVALTLAVTGASANLLFEAPWQAAPHTSFTALKVPAVGDGDSDGTVDPTDPLYGHASLPQRRSSAKLSHLLSSSSYRDIAVTPGMSFTKLRALKRRNKRDEAAALSPRYVSGLTAPSGYTYSWVTDGNRLAMNTRGAPSYLTRYTVSKHARRTTQNHVNACVAFCDETPKCAMATVIKFIDFAEGNVICAVYSQSLPKSEAKYNQGLFHGAGHVKSSYTFTRNAGQVPASTPSSTSTSLQYDQWVWIDVAGTLCSDGTQTGMAINLHSGSEELVIGLQEGGSCHDYQTCYVDKKAYNIPGSFTNTTFNALNIPDNIKWWFPFARDNQYNPWQQSNYAWIPYCTGDFHAGDNVIQYNGASAPTYHKGWNNVKADMAELVKLVSNLKRVWIAGSSAGAFGSILQYQNAQDAFNGVRVDLLADSGETPKSILMHPSQNIQVPNKVRCPNCDDESFDSYIVGLAQANTDSRFASMSYSNDTTIPGNQGVSSANFSAELVRLFNEEDTNTINARNFMVQGNGHTLLYTTQYNAADGYTQATFLNKFKTDDPGWSSH